MSRRIASSVRGPAVVVALLGSAISPASHAQAAPGSTKCVTSQLQQVKGPGPVRALKGSVPVVFIHGILSTAALWNGSSGTSMAGQAAALQGKAWQGQGPTAWTFNYGPQHSLDWVTNAAIAPAFAKAVSCLAENSGHQVVIVAHSMGGLAAQFAVRLADPYGGSVGDHVAELITIGTPYQGSWFLSAVQALRTGARWVYPAQYLVAAEAITSACAGRRSGICALLNVPPSPVGTALELKSQEISNLPPWPARLKVYDIAGDIKVIQLVAGPLYGSLDLGDAALLTGSATAHDTASNGKAFVENCGTETFWNFIHGNGGPCYHVNLPSNPDVTQTVLTSIRAAVSDQIIAPCTAAALTSAINTAKVETPGNWKLTGYACQSGYAYIGIRPFQGLDVVAILKQQGQTWKVIYGPSEGLCLAEPPPSFCQGFKLPLPWPILQALMHQMRASLQQTGGGGDGGTVPLGYSKYTNPRFGFTTIWPSAFTAQPPPENGDGQAWASPDGLVKLSAFGANNVLNQSPQQDESSDSQGLSVAYRDVTQNIVTVSGYKDGGRVIVYQRDVVGPGSIDTLYWSYPASQKAQWDSTVSLTANAFQPGDVATSH
jgi:triacylglycerol lipase